MHFYSALAVVTKPNSNCCCLFFQDYNTIRTEHGQLKQKVLESERTMEELGFQLSQSKLQVKPVFECFPSVSVSQ